MNAPAKVEASIASAYVAAFAEIEGAVKDAKNPHFKSKYADLPAIIAAIKPALIRHGLAFTQPCQPSEEGVTVSTVLHHSSGEAMDLGSLFVPANKKDAQGFGSALTYARRYALVSAFGVPTEDDDGNAASSAMNRQAATITESQFQELQKLIDDSGADVPGICTAYGISAVAMLPAGKFDILKAQLNKKLTQRENA